MESISTIWGFMDDDRRSPEERFTRLYDTHYAAVRSYAWRRQPDKADDIAAETFAIAWQRLDDLPPEPLPWLLGVARNVRLNMRRGERRRRDRETRYVESIVAPSFEGSVETHTALWAAIRRLPRRDQEILLLAAWERLDRAGLATVLGCSRATAGVRLYRARRRLEAVLAADGHSPATQDHIRREVLDER
jgi:RNA polymerase sigma factor (sigma-70 family)